VVGRSCRTVEHVAEQIQSAADRGTLTIIAESDRLFKAEYLLGKHVGAKPTLDYADPVVTQPAPPLEFVAFKVPLSRRDQAKLLGAVYDSSLRTWGSDKLT